MKRTFLEAADYRRSIYTIDSQKVVSRERIEEILLAALSVVPSAFNSRTTRLVLLTGENHLALWRIVKETLRKIVPAESFVQTEQKIDGSFASGYATVLFYEDMAAMTALQKQFPPYANRFPTWGEHTSAMHQFAIWTMMEDEGLGASLQHYNPLIDNEVAMRFNIPSSWRLIAQMPLGNPTDRPAERVAWDAKSHYISL